MAMMVGQVARSSVARRADFRAKSRWYSTENEQGLAKDGKSDSETETPRASGSGEASSSEQSAESEVTKQLKAKEQEVVDITGRLRYLQADFVNLQRNAAREKEQTRDFAITRFAGDLLETVDVLSLALKSVPESILKSSASPSTTPSGSDNPSPTSPPSDASSSTPAGPTKSALDYLNELHHGVEMTHRLLLQTLFKYNIKPFDPTGDKFDPNRHEALFQVPMPGKESGTVIDCQKVGYTIKDRTLRAAQVGVVSESS